VPRVRVARFANATERDLAWMARRIARITPAHVDAALASGGLGDARLRARLRAVLLARRAVVLRWAAARRAPLDRVEITPEGELCAQDPLAAEGIEAPRYAARLRRGAALDVFATVAVRAGTAGVVCVPLPPPAAAPGAAASASPPAGEELARRVAVDLQRTVGAVTTRLRVHLRATAGTSRYAVFALER
jgi:hypothetical protein